MSDNGAPSASFDEIRALLPAFKDVDAKAQAAVAEREVQLTKPAGSLGRLESLVSWLAGWQGRTPPRVDRPRVCVFAANHGVAAQGVSAYPAEVTAQMVQNFIDGGAAVNQICRAADAELRVYEMSLETPTRDFTREPAMDEVECARAMAYGMMAVEPGTDILALGEMGIANTTSAAAICHALFGGSASDWTGPGTGVAGERLSYKTELVARAVAEHAPAAKGDPLEILRLFGGFELAAVAGAVLAARLGRVPVLLDGYAATAAAAVIHAMLPGGLDHCLVAHCSAEPGHARLLDTLGKEPLLNLGMRLGEASGAALAIPLLRAACETHSGMATFADAGVATSSD